MGKTILETRKLLGVAIVKLKIDRFRKIFFEGLGDIDSFKDFYEKRKTMFKGDPKLALQPFITVSKVHIIAANHFYAEIYGLTDETKATINRLKKFYNIDKVVSEVDLGF